MIARAVKLVALVAVATASVAATDPDTSRRRFSGPCSGSFTPPAALVMAGDRPVAFGRTTVAEIFAPGSDHTDYALQKFCFEAYEVVGAAADSQAGVFDVATPSTIERVTLLPDGTTWIPTTLDPLVGSGERVEAIATNTLGQIAAVVPFGVPFGGIAPPRFRIYDRGATGIEPAVHDFQSSSATSDVSAVAFDAAGDLYVYDDAGEILEFASDASGSNATPVRRIAGPATLLRPASAEPHGTRPITIDRDGNIIAADDRFVMTFAKDANGNQKPLRTLVSRDRVYGLGTDSHGYLCILRANVRGDNPTTSIKVFDPAADSKPFKEDVISI